MSVQAKVRVRHPYRGQLVEVLPEQAEILRQLRRCMDYFHATAHERADLAQKEWKKKAGASVLAELELFDNDVAGAASWCEPGRKHPDPQKAIRSMNAFDAEKATRHLKGYPALSDYVQELIRLRQLVTRYMEQQV